MINKDNTIGEILEINPKAADILSGFGMGCLGCPSATMETLEQACYIHGLDLNEVMNKLNEICKFCGKNENITAFNNTLACKECIEKIEKKLVKRYKSERLLFYTDLAIWFAYVEALIFLIFKRM